MINQEALWELDDYYELKRACALKRESLKERGGLLVRQIRETADLSVRSFARLIEVTPSYLSKIENHKEEASAEFLHNVFCWARKEGMIDTKSSSDMRVAADLDGLGEATRKARSEIKELEQRLEKLNRSRRGHVPSEAEYSDVDWEDHSEE